MRNMSDRESNPGPQRRQALVLPLHHSDSPRGVLLAEMSTKGSTVHSKNILNRKILAVLKFCKLDVYSTYAFVHF
jgi:hypothetical protein